MPSPLPELPAPLDLEPLSRHRNVGLLFSGGKDSLAIVYLLRDHLDRLTVYHCDTGDLLPEIADVVAKVETMCPRFVRVKTNARGWIAANGLPADLLPIHCGPVGRLMHHGEAGAITVVDKHHCCDANRWTPLRQRLDADGVTLNIRGTRRADPGYGIVAATPGYRPSPHSLIPHGSAIEFWWPIEDWSDADVLAYLRSVGAPLPPYYEHRCHAPECARCPAGWSEGRAAYLAKHYPELADDYATDLRALHGEIAKPLASLESELEALHCRPDSTLDTAAAAAPRPEPDAATRPLELPGSLLGASSLAA